MNNRISLIGICLTAAILLYFSSGCGGGELGDSHIHDDFPTVSLTRWTGEMEMFTEYEVPAVGHPVQFVIHLTKLSDFSPVRSGSVTLRFRELQGSGFTEQKQDKLFREGIFTPTVKFEEAGKFSASLNYLTLMN